MTSPLLAHLSKTLTLSPPQSNHPPATLTGPLTSHTGTAYLFLSVGSQHPHLQIHSYPAIHWAHAYVSNIPTPSSPVSPTGPGLGLSSDALAGSAVRACVTQDLNHVRTFLALLSPVLDSILSPETRLPTCLVHGLAGTLYLLRLIRHWVPSSAPLVSRAIVHVSEYLLSPPVSWSCPDNSEVSSPNIYGAAEGELGTLTQLLLTTPPLAPRLTSRLSSLLELQLPNGDWPSIQEHTDPDNSKSDTEMTDPNPSARGFASGPQGLIISLLSLRPFFPSLQARIGDVISKAREYLQSQHAGCSSTELNLFHGVLSTALSFPKGPQRTHFLSLSAPDNLPTDVRASENSSLGSVMASYDPGAAWMWAVSERDMPRMIFYNDI